MKLEELAQKSIQEIITDFTTSAEQGLSEQEAANRLKKHGQNTIATQESTWWHILLRQFESPFMYLLLGAAFISIFLHEPLNTVMIIAFVFLATSLGFYQEFYAEKTVSLLKKYLTTSAQVKRNGTIITLPTESLVPGDIIILSAGHAIPADVRFLKTEHVWVDESALTGESMPVAKSDNLAEAPVEQTASPVTIGLCGSMMTSGTAEAIVVATGNATQFGSIAYLSTAITRRSIFAQEIHTFSSFVLYFVMATIGVVFFAHYFIKGTPITVFELALFAIALAISIVPEALPLVITFALSFGARKLAEKNVVVKRLSAIEDLGGINILCTDKTGTITKNILTVAQVYSQDPDTTLLYAGLASEEAEVNSNQINSFDQAIMQYLSEDIKAKLKSYTLLARLPFDHKARSNAALISNTPSNTIILRGAVEFVMQHCKTISDENAITQWTHDQGLIGHRIIALASKSTSKTGDLCSEDLTNDFTLIGLLSFQDPVKPTALEALSKAQQLGVALKIITGDAVEVAVAVGKEMHLVENPDQVVTGKQFNDAAYDEKVKLCEKASVFARILPEQKFQIIEILQKDHNVGFLGEGINDAPALKAAHIGIAVHNSTDIAKNAADIILLRKSLTSIVDGIEQGRQVMENSFKYLRGMVTSNFSNFYTIAFVSLILDYLPMLPMQLLLINFLTDFPLISIATDNTDARELKQPKRNRLNEAAWLAVCLGLFSTIFDLTFFSRFYHAAPEILRTNWFMYCIFSGLLFFFSIRTKRFLLIATRPSWSLLILSTTSIVITIVLPYTSLGMNLFAFVPPTKAQLAWTFGMSIIYLIGMESAKLVFYRYFKPNAE